MSEGSPQKVELSPEDHKRYLAAVTESAACLPAILGIHHAIAQSMAADFRARYERFFSAYADDPYAVVFDSPRGWRITVTRSAGLVYEAANAKPA